MFDIKIKINIIINTERDLYSAIYLSFFSKYIFTPLNLRPGKRMTTLPDRQTACCQPVSQCRPFVAPPAQHHVERYPTQMLFPFKQFLTSRSPNLCIGKLKFSFDKCDFEH